MPHPAKAIRFSLLCLGIAAAWAPFSRAEQGDNDITAVSARTSSDYIRPRQADGSYAVEYYAFGNGGHYGGQMVDQSIDKLKFTDVAKVIASPLAHQNYIPATNPDTTKLLIMVYWGLSFMPGSISGSPSYANFSSGQYGAAQSASMARITASNLPPTQATGYHPMGSGSAGSSTGLRDDQMAALSSQLTTLNILNGQRERLEFETAKMLGYDYDGSIGTERGKYVRGTAFGLKWGDLLTEINENRYFVVLMAYDFQLLAKQKKHKLVWETRFSIRQSRHDFERDLPSMARFASQYFGQDTHGLVRKPVPLGTVKIGPTESLGSVDAPAK